MTNSHSKNKCKCGKLKLIDSKMCRKCFRKKSSEGVGRKRIEKE